MQPHVLSREKDKNKNVVKNILQLIQILICKSLLKNTGCPPCLLQQQVSVITVSVKYTKLMWGIWLISGKSGMQIVNSTHCEGMGMDKHILHCRKSEQDWINQRSMY